MALGGALGGAARYALTLLVTHRTDARLPWGTLFVNVSGAGAIGVFVGLSGGVEGIEAPLGAFLVAGVLGSYTTVSAFSLQTLSLLRAGAVARAAIYAALSFGLCLGAAAFGYIALRSMAG